jgi:hypothetical protein
MRLPSGDRVLAPGGCSNRGCGTTLAATVVLKSAGSGQNPEGLDSQIRPSSRALSEGTSRPERRGQRRPLDLP